MKKFCKYLLIFFALSVVFEPMATEYPATGQSAVSQKKKTKKGTFSKKKKTTSTKKNAAPTPAPAPKRRTPVVRGDEILQLKAKKDGDTKLYGYENVGPKYYWWAEAHYLGAGKEQLNLGYETQWVITPQYTHAAKEFSEGLAAVEINGKVGFIDRLNRFVIPPVFDPMDDLAGFRYGLAVVKKDGKFGFINKKGEFVINPIYDDAENFGNDYLAVVKRGKKFGCIDIKGDSIVPCTYIAKEMMKNVPMKNKPYREAKKMAKERWDQGYYNNALIPIDQVSDDVDSNILNPDWQEPAGNVKPDGAPAGDGFYIVSSTDGKKGVTDSYGRKQLPCIYKNVTYDKTQRVFIVEGDVTTPEKYNFVGTGLAYAGGGWIIPPVFDSVGNFNAAGGANVTVGTHQGRVNVFGKVDDALLMSLLEESMKEKDTHYTRRLIGILPTCAAAHNCLGIYYASTCDNLKDAIHHFTVAHNLDPENKDFEANMKAAKSTRNDRRWNRVLTGLNIAAAVLTLGAVTYSAVNGGSVDSSTFSSAGLTADDSASSSYSSGTSSHGGGGSSATNKCMKCMGSGTCSTQSGTGMKNACHGSGLCGYCHGTGWIKAGGSEAICRACNGKGKCKTCGGTGKCKYCHGTGHR